MSQNKLMPSVFNDMVTPPNSVQRRKSKPMIVDITINDHGEQIYKVQNTRETSRKRKYEAEDDNEVTPVRTALGIISPNTLNQNKRSNLGEKENDKFSGSPSTRTSNEPVNDVNIWSEDVEEAFEEALRIIPKNGLTKIKISGKSCGRNELISDYIYQNTGKQRTRKQVSSHIQVIKNLKKNKELIELINNGPSDPDAMEKFDEIFSEISFQKSIGGSNATDLSTPKPKPTRGCSRKSPLSNASRRLRTRRVSNKPIEFTMKKFEMTYLDFDEPFNSHTFTKLSSPKLDQALRLKPDANISNRFPNLNDYYLHDVKQDLQIPILHSMVNLNLPPLDKKVDGKHETKLQVELKNVPVDEKEFGCLTVIYSFGNEVIRLVDDVLVVKQSKNISNPVEFKNRTLELPFAQEFWNAFLKSIENNINDSNDVVKSETQKTIAVKAITMKQIIFAKQPPTSNMSSSSIHPNDIKSILLWEFTKSNESSTTTTRRLYLPNPQSNTQEEIQYLPKVSEVIKEEDTTMEIPDDDDEEEGEEAEEGEVSLEPGFEEDEIVKPSFIPLDQQSYASSISSAHSSTHSASSSISSFHNGYRTQSFPGPSYFPSQHHPQLSQLHSQSQPSLSQQQQQSSQPPIGQLRRMQSEPNTSVFYNHDSSIHESEFQSDDFPAFSSNNHTSNSQPVFNSFAGPSYNTSTTLSPGFMHLDGQMRIEHDHHGEIFSW